MEQKPDNESRPAEKSESAALPPPKKPYRSASESAIHPSVTSSLTRTRFLQKTVDADELLDHAKMIQQRARDVSAGNMSLPEEMLLAQAMSLDMIFNHLAQRGADNIGTHLPTVETYMRMALKAQSQCSATLRVLGELRAPRSVMFIKEQQNNVAHGHQQVNNHAPVTSAVTTPVTTHVRRETVTPTNELLAERSHAEEMDSRAACSPGRSHPDMAPVGSVDGSKIAARQESVLEERSEARHEIG